MVENLNEKCNLYAILFQNAPESILILKNNKIVSANKMACKLFGLTSEDLCNKNIADFFPEAQPNGINSISSWNMLLLSSEPDQPESFEWELLTADKSKLYCELSISSIQIEHDQYKVVMIHDITHKRQKDIEYHNFLESKIKEKTTEYEDLNRCLRDSNEELSYLNEEMYTINDALIEEISDRETIQKQLEESEEKYRCFINQSAEGICLISESGDILEWNWGMESISDLQVAKVLGRKIWEIPVQLLPNNPDTKAEEEGSEIFRNFISQTHKEVHQSVERVVTTPKGERKWVRQSFFPICTSSGLLIGMMVSDVTTETLNKLELEEYKNHLERMVTKKSDEVVNLSHRFKEVYDNSSDCILLIDVSDNKQFKYVSINPASQRYLGITNDFLGTGRFVHEVLAANKANIHTKHYLSCVESGEVQSYEERTENNSIVTYWQTQLVPVRNSVGQVYRIAAFSHDITAEKLVQKEKDFSAHLFDQVHSLIIVLDTKGRFVRFNKACEELTGYTFNEVVGKFFWDILIPPAKRSFIKLQFNELKRDKKERISENFWQTRSGDLRYIMLRNSVIDHSTSNDETFIVSTGIDLTDRTHMEHALRENEEKYRMLFEQMLNGFVLYDPVYDASGQVIDLSINMVNPSAGRILDTDVNVFVGKTTTEIYGKPDDSVIKLYHNTLNANKELSFPWFSKRYQRYFHIHSFLTSNDRLAIILEDVTEQKNAENALRNANQRLKLATEVAQIGIWEFNLDTHEVIWDEMTYSIHGLDSNNSPDLLKSMIELYGQEQTTQNNLLFQQLRNTDKILDLNTHFTTPAGEIRYARNMVSVRKSFDKKTFKAIGVIFDVTPQVKSINKLKEREAQLSSIIQNLPFDFWARDKNGLVTIQNSISKQLWGDCIGMTLDQQKKDVSQDLIAIWEETNRRSYNGEVVSREIDFVTKDGNQRFIQNITAPIIEEDTVIGILGLNIDFTDRRRMEIALRRSEEKFRTIVDYSNDGIVIVKTDGSFIEVNSAIMRFTELSRAEFEQMHVYEAFPKNKILELTEKYNEILQGKELSIFETDILTKSGQSKPVEINARIIEFEEEPALLAIIRDINDRKQIERRLFETIVETEENERRRIAGDLHDDIAPQLASLRMYMSTLSRKIDHPEYKPVLDLMVDILKNVTTTIRDISNNLSPHLLESYGLAAGFNSEVEIRSNEIKIHYTENLEDMRFSSKIEIMYYRILKELINNTIKYAKATLITIKLMYVGNELIFIYSDNGVGFNYSKLMTKNHKGIGLLNIISRVKSIDGQYAISSRENEGFLFELRTKTTPVLE